MCFWGVKTSCSNRSWGCRFRVEALSNFGDVGGSGIYYIFLDFFVHGKSKLDKK